jgi:hypothetical protein
VVSGGLIDFLHLDLGVGVSTMVRLLGDGDAMHALLRKDLRDVFEERTVTSGLEMGDDAYTERMGEPRNLESDCLVLRLSQNKHFHAVTVTF